MKKLGIKPKQPIRRQPPPVDTDHDVEFTQELVQPPAEPVQIKEPMLSQMLSEVKIESTVSPD